MGRHAPGRRGLAAAVSSFAVAVAAVSITVLPQDGASAEPVAPAAAGSEITLTDPSSATPRTDRPYAAGASGFLHRQAGVPGLLWTDGADGTTVTVENADGSVYTPGTGCTVIGSACRTAWYGTDGDLVALPTGTTSTSVALWNPVTDERTQVAFGATNRYYRALAGDTVVTGYSLVDEVDGQRRERVITGESTNIQSEEIVAADSAGVLWTRGNGLRYIDTATAVNTQVFTDATYATHYVMSEDRIGWYQSGTAELHLKDRHDLSAPERVIGFAHPGVALDGDPVLVGDRLLLPLDTGTATSRLAAVSVTDGRTETLLDTAGAYAIPAPGGDALVTGGSGATDWWVQRVSRAEDGSPKLEKVHQVPAKENPKTGLAFSRGSLRVAEDDPAKASDTTSVRQVGIVAGTPAATAATDSSSVTAECPYAGATCSAMFGNYGSGPRDVYLETYADVDEGGSGLDPADRLVQIGATPLEFHTGGGTIVDVSDGYAVYDSGGSTPAQYVGEFGQGQKLKRSIRAAALHGPTLWSATSTAGKLTSYSLTQDKSLATVTVPGLACVPSELQAAGRWVYWACGTDSAGVYDSTAGTSRPVPPGDVLLGDGFTVRHDHGAGELVLTDASTGATRVLASGLPDTGPATDRRHRWTVDEYTGMVAWFDGYERTHVAATHIAPSTVTAFRTQAGSYVDPNTPLAGNWLLSRPVESWSVTFTSVQSGATGRVTSTVSGGASAARVATDWYGKTATGAWFPTGRFTWTLKATGTGTSTPVTVATGEGFLSRGAAVRHDFTSPDGPDGRGDLLTLNSSGGLTFQAGTGTGRFGDKTTGTGWSTTVKAVPFGDLSGDRCNDVLVRYSSGALRLYKPGCGKAVTPKTSYTTLASSGWTQYDVLTSPGDVSGDGRPDLIARNASTGAVYLHKGTSDGKLSSRVKLYDDWRGYKKIVGAGDLDGDGIGDLLAQDKANTLYRYRGTGGGTFAARAKVFTDWGGSYNVVVGIGDITDDGRADLVSRDTSGNVYRNDGNGKGSFGSRTKIATGWGGYKSLS
ncbi:FG-GAP repeat domain-containing protein [Streptomyces bungoensis]|uniref:FG-GAP repeat domain-containing protein n=1 Tax=Streptomyces bungoensis TaxID=285568 RepID=UPI0036B4271F